MIVRLIIFLSFFTSFGQEITTDSKLKIEHGDLTLYLSRDTCSMVSVHKLKYSDILKLDKDRDDNWFHDTFKSRYKRALYAHSGYDLGHLTPSHITSYNDTINHGSFSLFNQAPQIATFNRGKWASLEKLVEEMIIDCHVDVIVITGVIYNIKNPSFLPESRIPIPSSFYKVLVIESEHYVWLGSNLNANIIPITIDNLNDLFKINKMNLNIKI